MSSRHRLTTALAILCLASPLAAQTLSRDTAGIAPVAVTSPAATVDQSPAVVAVAPSASRVDLMNAPVGLRASDAHAASFAPLPPSDQGSRNPAMMIVGGAALVVGAVIGGKAGTIIMIGGGVVGLFGLWNYLQ